MTKVKFHITGGKKQENLVKTNHEKKKNVDILGFLGNKISGSDSPQRGLVFQALMTGLLL